MLKSFISLDNAYLYKNFKTVAPQGSEIDYAKLLFKLKNLMDLDVNRETFLLRAISYDGIGNDPQKVENKEKLSFYIHDQGFIVKLYQMQQKNGNGNGETYFIQKKVDVAIAMDAIELSAKGAIDIALILNGDKDFVELVEKLKQNGTRVHVAGFKSAFAKDLRICADRFYYMDDFIQEIIK